MKAIPRLIHILTLSLAIFLLSTQLLNTAQIDAAESLPKIKRGDPLPANLFVELAKAINPAVVNINTSQLPRGGGPQVRDPFFDLFEQFMGPNPYTNQMPRQSLGTGFIIRDDGLILTNNHVIEQADVIKVQLDEKTKELFEARVIGRDDRTDIALIKIDAKRKLPVAQLGTSSSLEVGEWVAAFGNPYGHGHSITQGIISAIGREIEGLNLFPFLQTDASINPGNSGGPLVNTQGLVIGVNTAIDARAQGIGFAIPIDYVKGVLAQLEKDGRVKRGYIGVYMTDIDEDSAQSLNLSQTEGALITQVVQGSPADKSGLQPYDLVVEFNGQKVTSTNDLATSVAKISIGKKVDVKIIRNSKPKNLSLLIADQPNENGQPEKVKKYQGQKAPFDLGFSVTDFSERLAQEFGIPPLREGRPIVIDVTPNSPASLSGLAAGDVILDVNRVAAVKARDILKLLRPGINVLRILKRDRVLLLYLRTK